MLVDKFYHNEYDPQDGSFCLETLPFVAITTLKKKAKLNLPFLVN
jgi:hypothetical protein